MKTNPIHQDELLNKLKEYGSHFVAENGWVIPIEEFIPLFVYKYGGFLSEWTLWIEEGEKYPEVHCGSIGGMRYIFPICNKCGERERISKRELNEPKTTKS